MSQVCKDLVLEVYSANVWFHTASWRMLRWNFHDAYGGGGWCFRGFEMYWMAIVETLTAGFRAFLICVSYVKTFPTCIQSFIYIHVPVQNRDMQVHREETHKCIVWRMYHIEKAFWWHPPLDWLNQLPTAAEYFKLPYLNRLCRFAVMKYSAIAAILLSLLNGFSFPKPALQNMVS